MNPYQSPQTRSQPREPVEPPVIFFQFLLHGMAGCLIIIGSSVLSVVGIMPKWLLMVTCLLNYLAVMLHGFVAVLRWNRR